ncbi:phosphatidic acid phosphatase [Streptomyces longwoodensis]|uniref:Phosphatidic acid phosphatase n=1 Tax=Streptomyces longwoodensis TaxID=68231 RepID=A0A101R2F7_9ACTN|nr:phosphatase PAP2 family protein [Streptomyces longwoodensis]KUN40460.1 phosphatidic acid phosphatase [Streptomyces longwoodensis]
MKLLNQVRDADELGTKEAASRIPAGVAKVLSAVEEAAESSKLWCGMAGMMAWRGGPRGRRAAAAGIAAIVVAQLVSNGVGKQVTGRRRPPKEWIPHDEVEDRPDSSSFPSGHTAAAVAFTAAVTPAWPVAGALCAVPAAAVAVERVQSGAHYPSDVAAGAAIGLTTAWLTHRAAYPLRRRLITL